MILDWRTFLRNTELDIDLFVTRAAIDELELVRTFKPSCFYNKSTVVYWAAETWRCHTKAEAFVNKIEGYKLGQKNRKLVFFKGSRLTYFSTKASTGFIIAA